MKLDPGQNYSELIAVFNDSSFLRVFSWCGKVASPVPHLPVPVSLWLFDPGLDACSGSEF
jgi:hypothetical protein